MKISERQKAQRSATVLQEDNLVSLPTNRASSRQTHHSMARLSYGQQRQTWMSPIVAKKGPTNNPKINHNTPPSSTNRVSTSASEAMQSFRRFQINKKDAKEMTSRISADYQKLHVSKEIAPQETQNDEKDTDDSQNLICHQKSAIIQHKFLIQTYNKSSQHNQAKHKLAVAKNKAEPVPVKSKLLQDEQNMQILAQSASRLQQANASHTISNEPSSKDYFKSSARNPHSIYISQQDMDGVPEI